MDLSLFSGCLDIGHMKVVLSKNALPRNEVEILIGTGYYLPSRQIIFSLEIAIISGPLEM